MDNVIIEGKASPKKGLIIFLRVMAVVYFMLIVTFPLGIVFLCLASSAKNSWIKVTETSVIGVYGSIAKKEINLPIDSIDSVMSANGEGFMICTQTQCLSFNFMPNAKEIVSTINNLIKTRQENNNITSSLSNADELQKYKKLLDDGIITKEEFDAKKKQLLGL